MTKDQATLRVAEYVAAKGMALTIVAESTRIPYNAVYASLGAKTRALRGDEFLSICEFIEADPAQFGHKGKAS